MEQNDTTGFQGRRGSRIWNGLVLLIIGVLLLAYKMGAPIPGWIFTWPMILIVIGSLIGIKSRFQNPAAFIMLAIGGIFLADKFLPEMDFRNYILPVILIGIGLTYILKPKRSQECWNRNKQRTELPGNEEFNQAHTAKSPGALAPTDNPEYLDINAVFGGVKKNIFSKNFQGGEINCVMGGAEINLLQAEIKGQVRLEINNVFGGTKLIVPANWNVKNEITAVFGGIEDKRHISNAAPDLSKTIIITGSCVFGGIEISNY